MMQFWLHLAGRSGVRATKQLATFIMRALGKIVKVSFLLQIHRRIFKLFSITFEPNRS